MKNCRLDISMQIVVQNIGIKHFKVLSILVLKNKFFLDIFFIFAENQIIKYENKSYIISVSRAHGYYVVQ